MKSHIQLRVTFHPNPKSSLMYQPRRFVSFIDLIWYNKLDELIPDQIIKRFFWDQHRGYCMLQDCLIIGMRNKTISVEVKKKHLRAEYREDPLGEILILSKILTIIKQILPEVQRTISGISIKMHYYYDIFTDINRDRTIYIGKVDSPTKKITPV